MVVEFDLVEDPSTGRLKAVSVSAPDGAPIKPPPRRRNRRGKPSSTTNETNENPTATSGNGRKTRKAKPAKEREPYFYESIIDSAKEQIEKKGFVLGDKSTLDVSFEKYRIKLGQGGYAGLASKDAILGEGTYVCDENGAVSFSWQRSLQFSDGEWRAHTTESLISSINLATGKEWGTSISSLFLSDRVGFR